MLRGLRLAALESGEECAKLRSELTQLRAAQSGTRNAVYVEAIKAVEVARDEWETEGRKHWWPQVAQAVIGVLRARAALGEKKGAA